MNKEIKKRTCIVCRKKDDKQNLIRFVKNENISLDENQIMDGRGCYVCNSKDCLNRLIEKRQLNKAFKMQISNETYLEIKKYKDIKFGERSVD